MNFEVSVSAIYQCTVERAFKTPMLCDVSKVHTGYGLMPRVTHCTEDENWGQPGSSKRVFAARSLTFPGGEASVDRVIERVENQYWKIEVSAFTSWMLGFDRFTGEWTVTSLGEEGVKIDYRYTLHANGYWFYPLNYLFAHVFWKKYMKRVLANVWHLIQHNEPYLYD